MYQEKYLQAMECKTKIPPQKSFMEGWRLVHECSYMHPPYETGKANVV